MKQLYNDKRKIEVEKQEIEANLKEVKNLKEKLKTKSYGTIRSRTRKKYKKQKNRSSQYYFRGKRRSKMK